MSIEAKHAYRFGYLKSEEWKTVRLEALVREKGKCQICGEESISNDAHHIWYPESVYDTKEKHLVILCRPCHEFIHVMLPECKTQDEELGMETWRKFRNSILAWRQDKIFLFSDNPENPSLTLKSESENKAKDLRNAYEALRLYTRRQDRVLSEYVDQFGRLEILSTLKNPLKPECKKSTPSKNQSIAMRRMLQLVDRLTSEYKIYANEVESEVEYSGYQI